MKNLNGFNFISNGEEIKKVRLIKISSKVKDFSDYSILNNELLQYMKNNNSKKYCLDFSNIKLLDYTRPLRSMMQFQIICHNETSVEPYFIMEDRHFSKMANAGFGKNKFPYVFNSRKDLEKFLSK